MDCQYEMGDISITHRSWISTIKSDIMCRMRKREWSPDKTDPVPASSLRKVDLICFGKTSLT